MRVWSVRLCTLTRSLSGCCCGSVLRVRADHATLCIHQFHWSSQHRHFLRQAVVVSASYSPAPLHVTNALRHDLNGLETLNLDVLGMYPDLLVLPFPYHHSLVLRFPSTRIRLHVQECLCSTSINSIPLYLRILFACCKSHCSGMVELFMRPSILLLAAPAPPRLMSAWFESRCPIWSSFGVGEVYRFSMEAHVSNWVPLNPRCLFHTLLLIMEARPLCRSTRGCSYREASSLDLTFYVRLLNLLHFKLVYKELPEPKLFLISSQGWQSIPDCMLSKTIQLYQPLLAYPTYRMRSNPPSKLLCAS